MADLSTAAGLRTLQDALAAGLAAQDVERVDEIDLERLAAVLASALARTPDPRDPEGDGLKPNEINSANDG